MYDRQMAPLVISLSSLVVRHSHLLPCNIYGQNCTGRLVRRGGPVSMFIESAAPVAVVVETAAVVVMK